MDFILLCDGITGFSNGRVKLPMMSRGEFKGIGFEIATTLKFKIEEFDFNLNGKNFYGGVYLYKLWRKYV